MLRRFGKSGKFRIAGIFPKLGIIGINQIDLAPVGMSIYCFLLSIGI